MKSVIIFHFLTSTYRRCFVFSEGLPQLFFLFSFLILNRALFTTEPENNQGFCAKDYHLFLFFVVFWSLSWSFPTTSRDHRLSLCSILRSCLRAGLFLGIIWTSTRNSSSPVLFSQCQAIRSCFRFLWNAWAITKPVPSVFCFRNVKQFDVKRAVWFSALLDRCVCQEN
jgi:hypothetical protein